jgi:hypothetical protein
VRTFASTRTRPRHLERHRAVERARRVPRGALERTGDRPRRQEPEPVGGAPDLPELALGLIGPVSARAVRLERARAVHERPQPGDGRRPVAVGAPRRQLIGDGARNHLRMIEPPELPPEHRDVDARLERGLHHGVHLEEVDAHRADRLLHALGPRHAAGGLGRHWRRLRRRIERRDRRRHLVHEPQELVGLLARHGRAPRRGARRARPPPRAPGRRWPAA